jgi:hypothetical protein
VWNKENIDVAVGEKLRAEGMRDIRVTVAEGVDRAETAKKVALRLGHETGNWSRNWERVANTELQGAYNDGQIINAVRVYGDDASVARVPHPTACEFCAAMFLSGGRPRIFTVDELIDNGTNVGKRSADWLPTIWPVHPNCRCDTQVVPPGFEFDSDWALVPEGMADD